MGFPLLPESKTNPLRRGRDGPFENNGIGHSSSFALVSRGWRREIRKRKRRADGESVSFKTPSLEDPHVFYQEKTTLLIAFTSLRDARVVNWNNPIAKKYKYITIPRHDHVPPEC